MTDFDERSEPIVCKTEWGRWWQTIDEVQIEIVLEKPISSKEISCRIGLNTISCLVGGEDLIKGTLAKTVKEEESTWTLEDKRLIRILLAKSCPDAANLWPSLLTGCDKRYQVDPFTLDQMQQKLTLQRYQIENPGMDFSSAEITGNYARGGPRLPID